MDDSKAITSKRQSFGIRPLLILVVPFVFVVVVWIISYSYFRHPFKNGQPLEYRIATNAAVGEAMAITSVLFSGLGFVALIATVWLQRKQIEAAIQGMEDSTKAQQENLKTLRAQSENTLAVAKISALAVQISACSQRLAEIKSAGPAAMVLGPIETGKRANLIAELETELEKLKEKSNSA
jgi:predicted histidine transporter YuiF (NhaC family)